MRTLSLALMLLLLMVQLQGSSRAGEPAPDAAARGYDYLLRKAYLPVEFDQESFDAVWQSWPEPLRLAAEAATPDQRQRMAFQRYGLTERPDDDSGKPLQYVVTEKGGWVVNCFACHGGKVAGRVIPGLPNSHFAMQTLTEEMRATKLRLGKSLTPTELAAAFFPLGGSNGTTNAVMFGVVLEAYRDKDLNLVTDRPQPKLIHHDMDAPPWWHFRKKKRLYTDGFVEKSHRALMPFTFSRANGPDKLRQWEDDFRDVFAYLESLEAPQYPYEVNGALALRGERVFNKSCAECHGTYGDDETYPQRVVPIDEVGTDRVRLDALSREHREHYGQGWLGRYGKDKTVVQPKGYMAPPLDGIWASAPYFHNGSVPTLWHVLRPADRPVVWRRTEDGYDCDLVGLEFEAFDDLPDAAVSGAEKRTYFDTRRFGKSAGGHTFPDELNDREKRALLEYLKTL